MSAMITGGPVSPEKASEFAQRRELFSFDGQPGSGAWFAVNDGVMGGLSKGRPTLTGNGQLLFTGTVSLENNGGFSSIRSDSQQRNLSDYDGLLVRLRGDGKKYALSIQTGYRIMAGAYYWDFDTSAENWQTLYMPFNRFQPRSFGRNLRNAPPLNAADIRIVGFIISDKQEGPFRLEVDWIHAVKTESDPNAANLAQEPTRAAATLIRNAIDRGVPLFNNDQPAACAAIYEITLQAMTTLADGQLSAEITATCRAALAAGAAQSDARQRAWTYRYALDRTLEQLETRSTVR